MKKAPADQPSDLKVLRAAAEAQVAGAQGHPQGSVATDRWVHELQVYQIELEMQNEQFRNALVALEESRDLFLDLYDFAPVGYMTLTEEGYVTEANLTCAKLFKMDRRKLLDRHFAGLVAVHDRVPWRQFLNELDQQSDIGTLEIQLLRADGDVLHAQVECKHHALPSGTTVVRMSLSDVGVRRKAAALVESEERLRLAMEAARQDWFDLDVRLEMMTLSNNFTSPPGASPAAQRLDLKGWLETIHLDDRHRVSSALRTCIAEGGPMTAEYRCQYHGGDEQWLRMDCRTVGRDIDGHPTRVIGVNTNISEQKRAESELIQHRHHLEELVASRTAELNLSREAAEAANRAKSAFLTTMSHELRSPMSGIFGMTELALQVASDPQQIHWLKSSLGAAAHLHSVINDVLDISRIEAELLVLEAKDFVLSDTINEALQIQQAAAQAKGLSLSWEVDSNLPHVLLGDRLRLRQILINLTSNAVKFSDQGHISVRALAVNQDDTEVMLRLEVADQGVGISAEEQSRLFAAFVQVDGSMSRQYPGSGLGLAITRRLARLMGGEAGVDSAVGQGSTFWVTVKLGRSIESPAESLPPVESARERLRRTCSDARVLVVDDDPVNREMMLGMLLSAGLVAESAINGQEALAMAREGCYTLILMDCQMPVMDGYESTAAIRLLPGMSAIPILAVTANAFAEDRKASQAAGMNEHLSKPLSSELFFQTLLKWLSRDCHNEVNP